MEESQAAESNTRNVLTVPSAAPPRSISVDGLSYNGVNTKGDQFPRRRVSESNVRPDLNFSSDSLQQLEGEEIPASFFFFDDDNNNDDDDEAHLDSIQLGRMPLLGAGRDADNTESAVDTAQQQQQHGGEPKAAEQLQFTKHELARQHQALRQEQMQKEHAKASAYFRHKFGLKEEKLVTCTYKSS